VLRCVTRDLEIGDAGSNPGFEGLCPTLRGVYVELAYYIGTAPKALAGEGFLCHEDWQSLTIIPTEIAQIGYSQTGQTSTARNGH
jgi:hypothetical protein